MWNARTFTLLGVVFAAAALRLLPHPPNFVPIGALALFGGAMFSRPGPAVAIPLAAMLLSDLALAGLYYGSAVFWSMPFVYAGFAVYVALGRLLRGRLGPLAVGTAAVGGSLSFFLITNFGTWLRGSLYPMTWEGLLACYAAGIPFYRQTLAGDLFYSAVLFGGFALAQRYAASLRKAGPERSSHVS